ncbi:TspO/MBR family protein [Niallia sp. NCCP-28]|uniref:TspO/MBR family protein n=1 Tax=Niallia sp. NCCP-28 TaxID=2934712 RepID=UPI002080F9A0|nr:TspO/MBR family protein [Niallia sp. NCCP-28]GKU84545.1 tryptophan-rich sensory protein [Niallia sp. NCCP-28]
MKQLFIHLIFFLTMVLINALANILPLNGQTTADISNKLNVLITPASYAFMIWGFIYILVGVWILRGFTKSKRNSPEYTETSFLFVVSCILNSCWIIVWHYELFFFSVLVILFLWITLFLLYKKSKKVTAHFLAYAHISIYLGWITVAAIVNISYYLKYISWEQFSLSDNLWTILLLLLATIIGIGFRIIQHDWIFPLVIVWSFIAIGIKNGENHVPIAFTTYVLAFILISATLGLKRRTTQT